jgi:ribonuclease VapC
MAVVLDSSALLAFFLDEPGHEAAERAIAESAIIASVNLAEVMTRFVRDGVAPGQAARVLRRLPVSVAEVDAELALAAGAMFAKTWAWGLSLGDRICMALAAREGVEAVTADNVWAEAGSAAGVQVRVVR